MPVWILLQTRRSATAPRRILRSLGVKNYDIYYVTISDNFFERVWETTSQLKELEVQNVSFPGRGKQELQAKIFCCVAGADHVIYRKSNWQNGLFFFPGPPLGV